MMITKMLDNLINIIEKSENYLNKRKIDTNLVVNSRLIIDMYPFSSQIQIATDMTRKGFARLAQIKSPSYKDNEKTLAQLKSRIIKTKNFLNKIDKNKFNDAENRSIEFIIRNKEFKFNNGDDYLNQWILPHFFFHVTTAYNILRMNGVNIGKNDYIGKY